MSSAHRRIIPADEGTHPVHGRSGEAVRKSAVTKGAEPCHQRVR